MRHLPAVLIYVWAIGGLISTAPPTGPTADPFAGLERVVYQLMFAVGIAVHILGLAVIPPGKPFVPPITEDGGDSPARDHSESIIWR